MHSDPSLGGSTAMTVDSLDDLIVNPSPPFAAPILDPTSGVDLDGIGVNGNGVSVAEPAAGEDVLAPPIPVVPPIPLPRQTLQGRYRSPTTGAFQVELRVDPDGRRPTNRVSADYYSVSGSTVTYFGSMRVDAAAISTTPTLVTITGLGTYTWSAAAPRVTVTIPRLSVLVPHAAATLKHSTTSGGPGATYVCRFESAFLRTVLLEQDRQDTVPTIFNSYNTGSLPSGGPARTLSIAGAYAEHGIEMLDGGNLDVIKTSETGANGTWSDAELHAAMQAHFSRWKDLPQWAVWLFHAQLHDIGPTLLGIMFDYHDRHQRQGAAVFYAGLGGSSAAQQRNQLYACVHELGHAFNLMHSWQKSSATPPVVDRPNALSYMNYPQRYPLGGTPAFWNAFAFQFDDPELIHLRHSFRDNIIMGGSNFGVGAALEAPDGWRTPEQDESGLQLAVRGPDSAVFGAPVSVDLTLSATDMRGKRVAPYLKPEYGMLDIAIRKPNGQTLIYRPLMQRCVSEEEIVLNAERPSISDSAYIGYGQHGFYFDHPGFYEIRARYTSRDGSLVLSNVLKMRIKPPLSEEDDAAAELVFGDEQGTLFYLVGSDYEGLARGNDALTTLRERYPEHPLAAGARLVQGVNAAREFKHVAADNTVTVRPARPEEAAALLSPQLNLGSLRSAAQEVEPSAAPAYALAAHLEDVAFTRGISAELRGFMRSRGVEIATELRQLPDDDSRPTRRQR